MASIQVHSYKTTIERGDIFYVESDYQTVGSEQRAGRPAIIVSNDTANKNSPVVEIVYLTTQDKNDQPTHVEIRSSTKPSTALCEQIDSVSKTRLGDYMATCTQNEMMNIDIALAISLGLDFAKPKEVIKEVIVEKPVEVVKEVVVEKPVEPFTFNVDAEQFYKAVAERNLFEELYQDLLKKLMDKCK